QTFIGNHDVTRIASILGPHGAVAALAILMTLGGTPSIYYGDELGATGVKEDRPGGDDAVRPPLPSSEPVFEDAARLLEAHRELIALRRARPWLTRARTTPVELHNERYRYRAAAPGGEGELEVRLDVSGERPCIAISEGGRVIWSRA
ncbi:alpha-amylase family glycosyl hydrolase, partial [Schaalia hyovaginalis]|uniref:alpha-amylase family glycosyl hydrolase n=1 Tax=Schaalia hyovaginalis TaxID=29316 RepID=UPI0026F07623